LAVLAEGRVVHQGPATFAAFSAGRAWRYRLHFAGQAEAAAVVIRRLADRVEALDATILDCTLESPPVATQGSQRVTLAEIVTALVRAGIAVEAAGLHPHWTEQLVEPLVNPLA
jgi:Leu/Phe-tRNA-protein transferase